MTEKDSIEDLYDKYDIQMGISLDSFKDMIQQLLDSKLSKAKKEIKRLSRPRCGTAMICKSCGSGMGGPECTSCKIKRLEKQLAKIRDIKLSNIIELPTFRLGIRDRNLWCVKLSKELNELFEAKEEIEKIKSMRYENYVEIIGKNEELEKKYENLKKILIRISCAYGVRNSLLACGQFKDIDMKCVEDIIKEVE